MKRTLFFGLVFFILAFKGEAQMAKWVMHPVYDDIRLASDAQILVSDSSNTSTLWSTKGKRLAKTSDKLQDFREGASVTTKRKSDDVTGFFKTDGSFVALTDSKVVCDYPFFSDGYLLLKTPAGYLWVDQEGTSHNFGSFVKAYPFMEKHALCLVYASMEKQKDPYYFYLTTKGDRVTFSLEDKKIDSEDVHFLSSMGADGKSIVVVKRKVYTYDGKTKLLEPMFANEVEGKKKRQISVDGQVVECLEETETGSILHAQGNKNERVDFVFNKLVQLVSIRFADREVACGSERSQKSEDVKLTSAFTPKKSSSGQWGLEYKHASGTFILPPQFEAVDFCIGDFAVVKAGGKWGMIMVDDKLNYRLQMNRGNDIAFRHQKFETTVRLDLPPAISANDCRFDIAPEYGCVIDKTSFEARNTESGNYVQYKCVLTIPDSLPDVITDIPYPVQIVYDDIQYPVTPFSVKAWHYKYINVDLNEAETVLEQGNVSFTINISAEKNPGEGDYPFEVHIVTDSLQTELEKISETRYKCKLYALAEGVNIVNINILEQGCPPAVFPFEITYTKPVKRTRHTPAKKEQVQIKKKSKAQPKTQPKEKELQLPV